jgi:hypothetical protein
MYDSKSTNISPEIPLTSISNSNQFEFSSSRRSSVSLHTSKTGEKKNYIVTTQEKADSQARHRFKSYRLKGRYEKPWETDPRLNKRSVGNWILRICIILGFGLSAFINYYNFSGVAKHDVSQSWKRIVILVILLCLPQLHHAKLLLLFQYFRGLTAKVKLLELSSNTIIVLSCLRGQLFKA